MKLESKLKLQKGRIYLKQGKWVVRYETKKMVKGGSPKQLGSYNTVTEAIYVPIRKEDTENLLDPYSQGKETCFELFIKNEIENGYKNQPPGMVGFIAQTTPVWYAKLWPVSEMAQKLQHYLETTPQEKIDEDWKKVEEFDLVGPTVKEFLGINQNNMKELYLIRGLPGSGKSTLAKSIGGIHIEADQYFVKSGVYEFDALQLKNAHNYCQTQTQAWMKSDGTQVNVDRIVVSNTFTTEWEMQPYFDLAEKYGYRVYSLIVENRHGGSENTNIHNVPKEKIDNMRERFQIKL
jgi:hypothetical protein